MQVVDDRRFVQMGEFCHIVCFVELGGIHFVDLVCVHFPLLCESCKPTEKHIKISTPKFEGPYLAII